MSTPDDHGFLSRWSRRKVQARTGEPLPDPLPPAAAVPPQATASAPLMTTGDPVPAVEATAPPPPTLEDTQTLTPASDFSRFVARDVSPEVRNAAVKKLFADPHFNLMDGLDVYIEDYGATTPILPSELRQMAQAKFLGLFDDEEEQRDVKAQPMEVAPDGAPPLLLSQSGPSAPDAPPAPRPDEDPDLRLQPDDAPGRPDPEPGLVPDAGRQP